ncbi:MAG TPA: serine hydrolase domain-containing protein [Nitrobacter sp.]|jgi:CubicO group peptidase (beta-lactamase class C family)|nr:serine hydrolase domain-containing protein [Nitrobacter sp.]
MKRLRTDGKLSALGAVALLALSLVEANAARAADNDCAGTQAHVSSSWSQDKLDRIGDYIKDEIATARIPGAVMLIQQHGKPVYFKCFGVRDIIDRHPMTPDTIFRLYSMSKPITSVAAMMLVERGKLKLGDPLSKYIPAFANTRVGIDGIEGNGQATLRLEPPKRPITIRDLLRHTSGITYGFYGSELSRQRYAQLDLYDENWDNAEFADKVAKLPLAEQPGTLWDYGHSTDVLGRVIEVVSGQTLYQFEKKNLLDPLGMKDTSFYVADKAKWPRIAQPMPDDRTIGTFVPITDPTKPMRWESGGGGMVGTVTDYARFAQMLLNRGTLDGHRYLRASTVATMTTDQIGPGSGIARDYYYFPGEGFGFGYGFAVRTQLSADVPGPLGEFRWDGVGGTFFWVDPHDDMLVIFMAQTPTERGPMQRKLRQLIYGALKR